MTLTALTSLKSSLEQVREVLALEAKYDDPPAPNCRAVVLGLRGGATVLTVACFEAFLKSSFEEQLDRIVDAGHPLHAYPEILQVGAVYSSLELAMKGDHKTRGTSKKDRIPEVLGAARSIALGRFNPRALSSTESNPNAECVKRMFKAVGLSEIFRHASGPFEEEWGQPVSVSHCPDKLDSLVSARNEVAHSAESAHLIRSELSENLRFIEALSRVLYASLTDHLDRLLADANQSSET